MNINLVQCYYLVHWSSTLLLGLRWVKYCFSALYIKSRCHLYRSVRDARPSPPLLSSRWLRRRHWRCWCCEIFPAAAAASVGAVVSGIAPPSWAAAVSSSVAVDAFLPPFLLRHSAARGAAARLLRTILTLGRPRLSPLLALYRASSSE